MGEAHDLRSVAYFADPGRLHGWRRLAAPLFVYSVHASGFVSLVP
jgi:hypothetical protein